MPDLGFSKAEQRKIRDLYAKQASYQYIADQLGVNRKKIDNFIYNNGIHKEVDRVPRGGIESENGHVIAPVHQLKKTDIVWMGRNLCKRHGVPYLAHYDCYLREYPDQARIGHFDIEASNLKASFGIVLCYCILDDKTGKIYERTITKKELTSCLDKKVVEQLVKDFKNFDIIYSYYGTGFDLPFVRTRAETMGIDFPEYGQLLHKDIYYIIKSKYSLHSKRMAAACEHLLGYTERTPITTKYWIKALQGDRESLEFITDHCRRDVRDLQRLSHKVLNKGVCRYVSV